MQDCELIREFRNYLRYEKHSSTQTARCYGADLEQFCEFLTQHFGTEETDGGQAAATVGRAVGNAVAMQVKNRIDQLLLKTDAVAVRSFLAYMQERRYSKTTIERKLVAVRRFYNFLTTRGLIEFNPAATVKGPKLKKKSPKFLEAEQVRRLLSMPATDNLPGARDRAIFETLYSTGMRVGELVALNTEDVDFLAEVVRVRNGQEKERTVPIGASALKSIQHYIELKNDPAKNNGTFDNEVLFANNNGRHLNVRSIRRKMDKYLAMAGLDPAFSPCTLRHSFARRMLDNGVDLRHLRKLLGHRSIPTIKVHDCSAATQAAQC